MDLQEFDRILQHTLSDYRLSRGEKRVLGKIMDEIDADEQKTALLRSRAFDIARGAVTSPEVAAVVDWLEEVVKALQPSPASAAEPAGSAAYFSPGESCRRKVISLLNQCRRQADICVFTITDDHITNAILDAKGRNVAVRVITDNEKSLDEGSDIHRLQRAGIAVRVDNTSYHMHHKFALFDQTCLLTGSYNWTRSAALYNEENLVVSYERNLTRAFGDQFEQLWRNLK